MENQPVELTLLTEQAGGVWKAETADPKDTELISDPPVKYNPNQRPANSAQDCYAQSANIAKQVL